MAHQYDNTNTGVLFKNEEKQGEKSPDYKGRINVGGTEFWLSAWIKEAKDKRKYMSLSITPMEQKAAQKPEGKQQDKRGGGAFSTMEDDVPFAPIGKGISGHAE